MKKILIIFILSIVLNSCWKILEDKTDNIITNNVIEDKNYIEQFFAQIDVLEFKKEIEGENVILLDIRTPEELIIYGKIRENQILIDIGNKNFSSEIEKLDKTKKYLVYCWHWNRSIIAREYMHNKGFYYVKDLAWWIDNWINEWESILK